MKHVVGLLNLTGMRITAAALLRVQSRMSGVAAVEQIRMRAVSIVAFRVMKIHAKSETLPAPNRSVQHRTRQKGEISLDRVIQLTP